MAEKPEKARFQPKCEVKVLPDGSRHYCFYDWPMEHFPETWEGHDAMYKLAIAEADEGEGGQKARH